MTKKLNILYVSSKGASADSFLKEHFRILKKRYSIKLICSPDDKAVKATSESEIELLPVPIDQNISLWADFRSLIKLINVIHKEKPSVVHAHMSKAALLSCLAAFICRVQIRVYHNHGMAYFSSTGIKRYVLGRLETMTCRLATHVIFCSQSTKQAAVHQGICGASRALILKNGTISGIDTTKFNNAAKKSSKFRNDLGIKHDDFIVGFVGRIVPHKGLHTLLQSWELLPPEIRQKAHLVIAGESNRDEYFEGIESVINANDDVYYLGRISVITELYQNIDTLVLPSLHEGFPYSVLEAQAMGIPAIVTRVTGNIDAVEDSVTGIHVSINSPGEISSAICKIITNNELSTYFSTNAAERVSKYFNQTETLQSLLEFYSNLSLASHKKIN